MVMTDFLVKYSHNVSQNFKLATSRPCVAECRLMSISSGEGTHVSELMRRTRKFLDFVEAEEAEQERLETLRKAAMGGGVEGSEEGMIGRIDFLLWVCLLRRI